MLLPHALINRVVSAGDYVGAASEGEAVAIAAGAWLGGRGTAVICQNSGLGNAVNPLTSLNAPFRIPTLLIPTWRGRPGEPDEPQHELMGRITHGLLDLMEIAHAPFPDSDVAIAPALAHARETLRTGRSFALVMAQGSVRDDGLAVRAATPAPRGTGTDLAATAHVPPVRACSRPCWRACPATPRSSPPPARRGASCSPSPTVPSISTRWARWAAPPAWDWAWRSPRVAAPS